MLINILKHNIIRLSTLGILLSIQLIIEKTNIYTIVYFVSQIILSILYDSFFMLIDDPACFVLSTIIYFILFDIYFSIEKNTEAVIYNTLMASLSFLYCLVYILCKTMVLCNYKKSYKSGTHLNHEQTQLLKVYNKHPILGRGRKIRG